jgi:hypothetical protein
MSTIYYGSETLSLVNCACPNLVFIHRRRQKAILVYPDNPRIIVKNIDLGHMAGEDCGSGINAFLITYVQGQWDEAASSWHR